MMEVVRKISGSIHNKMRITKEVVRSGGEGYGYRIFRDDRIFIVQDFTPAISGNVEMTERQAELLSDLVMKRLEEKPDDLPTVTKEEVEEIIGKG